MCGFPLNTPPLTVHIHAVRLTENSKLPVGVKMSDVYMIQPCDRGVTYPGSPFLFKCQLESAAETQLVQLMGKWTA